MLIKKDKNDFLVGIIEQWSWEALS